MEIESIIARGLQVLLALGGAYLVALWFVLVVWTFRDIEARSRNVVTQIASTMLVVFFYVPGFLLYWLLRPKETLDEAYQRSLEEEYLLQDLQELPLCPSCHHYVEDDYQLCPHCNTQLKDACQSCGRLVDLQWSVCPYCAAPQHRHDHGTDEIEQRVPDDEQWVDPDAIIARLRSGRTEQLPAATTESQGTDVAGTTTRERVTVTGRDGQRGSTDET